MATYLIRHWEDLGLKFSFTTSAPFAAFNAPQQGDLPGLEPVHVSAGIEPVQPVRMDNAPDEYGTDEPQNNLH
jgi:hypothetical protein